MALTFYYGAGSPYAWRAWLALEHKSIPYERKKPDLALRERIPSRINAWMQGVEILPFFPKTWPAHWK